MIFLYHIYLNLLRKQSLCGIHYHGSLWYDLWRILFGDLPEDRLLCPVRALRVYLKLTASVSPRPRSLFVSPSCLTRSLSKNALSFFLRKVVVDSGAVMDGSTPRAHSIRGVVTSALFLRNWSISTVLEAATWREV